MAVVPPQGGQQNYPQKPVQVYGEQYRAGGPLPVGAVAAIDPYYPAGGGPYVDTHPGVAVLHDTEWVLTNKRTGLATEVITDEEFQDRFGGGGAPLPT